MDATSLVGLLLLGHGLAKRIRWRVPERGGRAPMRAQRQAGRLLHTYSEPHPIDGQLQTYHIFEFSKADLQARMQQLGIEEPKEYATLEQGPWELMRPSSAS